MKVNRQELLSILEKLQPAVAKKEIIEQSTHFIFEEGVGIRTYNDQIAISAEFDTDINGTVPANELYGIINKIKDSEIDIETDDKNLIIKYGRKSSAKIAMSDRIKIIGPKLPTKQRWKSLPEHFHLDAKFCSFSASTNASSGGGINCIYVNDNLMMSTDRFRATRIDMGTPIPDLLLIPALVADQLRIYAPNKYLLTDAWVHLKNDDKVIFSFRKIEDEYPITEDRIDDMFNTNGEKVIFPSSFKEVVDRVQIMSQEDVEIDRYITLRLEKNILICESNSKKGSIKEELRIKYSGESKEVKVNPIFLSEILSHLKELTIGDKLHFQGDTFEHVICLSD